MANIDIERRQGTNTWVWVVVALVVVALLAWLLWPAGETTFQQQTAPQTAPQQQPAPAGGTTSQLGVPLLLAGDGTHAVALIS